jgi:hypothetical protein
MEGYILSKKLQPPWCMHRGTHRNKWPCVSCVLCHTLKTLHTTSANEATLSTLWQSTGSEASACDRHSKMRARAESSRVAPLGTPPPLATDAGRQLLASSCSISKFIAVLRALACHATTIERWGENSALSRPCTENLLVLSLLQAQSAGSH